MSRITIKQHDITDCGAACLASVAAHHGLQLPISRIRQYAGTDKKGTNVFGLIKAAEKMGFEAKGVRGDFESLFQIPKPAIAHSIIKGQLHHYVVLYRITKKHVFIMDPGTGKLEKCAHERFKKEWTGVLVLLLPNQDFRKGNNKVSIYSRFWYLLQPHRTVDETRIEMLKNVSLIPRNGGITAFVGNSGYGKSTLVSLLECIYPVNSGNIVIRATTLKYIKNESL